MAHSPNPLHLHRQPTMTDVQHIADDQESATVKSPRKMTMFDEDSNTPGEGSSSNPDVGTPCPGIAVDAGDRYVSAIAQGSSRPTRTVPRGQHPHAKPEFCAACGPRRSLKPATLIKRAAGIEPASSAWKAEVLPLHNARASTDKLPLLKGGARVSTPSL